MDGVSQSLQFLLVGGFYRGFPVVPDASAFFRKFAEPAQIKAKLKPPAAVVGPIFSVGQWAGQNFGHFGGHMPKGFIRWLIGLFHGNFPCCGVQSRRGAASFKISRSITVRSGSSLQPFRSKSA